MTDLIGLCAGALVLLTFSMTSMVWLRAVAIASNLAFFAYGVAAGLMPIWLLHAILLPINAARLAGALRAGMRPRRLTRSSNNPRSSA